MKNFLAFLAILVLVTLGVGYYRDWFSFSSTSSDGTLNINTQVDKEKIKEDVGKAKQSIQGTAKDLQEKIKSGTEPKKEKSQPQVPQDPPKP
jgi:hypothetical protein